MTKVFFHGVKDLAVLCKVLTLNCTSPRTVCNVQDTKRTEELSRQLEKMEMERVTEEEINRKLLDEMSTELQKLKGTLN